MLLNAMPLKRYHFDLKKSEFGDGIALHYGWRTVKMTSLCACNENFTVVHALHCPKRGYNQTRHKKLRNSFVNWLSDVCHDGKIDALLQPLQKPLTPNQRQLMMMMHDYISSPTAFENRGSIKK